MFTDYIVTLLQFMLRYFFLCWRISGWFLHEFRIGRQESTLFCSDWQHPLLCLLLGVIYGHCQEPTLNGATFKAAEHEPQSGLGWVTMGQMVWECRTHPRSQGNNLRALDVSRLDEETKSSLLELFFLY